MAKNAVKTTLIPSEVPAGAKIKITTSKGDRTAVLVEWTKNEKGDVAILQQEGGKPTPVALADLRKPLEVTIVAQPKQDSTQQTSLIGGEPVATEEEQQPVPTEQPASAPEAPPVESTTEPVTVTLTPATEHAEGLEKQKKALALCKRPTTATDLYYAYLLLGMVKLGPDSTVVQCLYAGMQETGELFGITAEDD